MSEKAKEPVIRFKGFCDEWEEKKFSDIAARESTVQKSSSAIPSVEYEDVVAEAGQLNKDVRSKKIEKSGIVFDGSQVLYGKLRPYLHNWLNPNFKGVAVGDWWVLKPIEANKDFLYRLIQTQQFDNIANQSAGSKMPRADWNLISNSKFMLPKSLSEQQKIGSYFRQLDHLITLYQRKYNKLTSVKKSMLQKMFPASGQTVPALRFAGFTDKWEVRKVKEVCSISTGKSNTQDHVENGKYPFYVRSPIIERSNRYLFDEEAVLTVGDGVGTGKVFHYVNGKYDLHQRVYRMFDFSDDITAKYFFYYFSNHFYDRVMAMTAKTSVDSVRYEMIADMDIAMPIVSEQKLIANYFRQLDHLIALHQQELQKLQNLKKACLKKMFV